MINWVGEISRAIQLNIQGIRLARFKAERKSEYFDMKI